IQPGWFKARERKIKPEAPAWLPKYCRESEPLEGDFAVGCKLLQESREDYAAALIKKQIEEQRKEKEAPTNTSWLSHVHVDALWIAPQFPATSYGAIGMHATMKLAGRLQFFVAPGAILLNVPTTKGTREWKPATDLGLTYRLRDVKFPGSKRT